MLKITDLHAFYGKSHVLHGISLEVRPGQIVALLGRNGSGRSTTAKAIMGLVAWTGQMAWKGRSLAGKRAFEVAHLGLAYVPESRDVFPALTVQQNLLLGQKGDKPAGGAKSLGSLEDMYRMFPQLHERRHVEAGVLSGGEQLMLSLCRSLMGDPEMLVIDEPTEGLAPQMVDRLAAHLQVLRQRGIAVLLMEQKLAMAMAICDRTLVMGRGEIVFDGTPDGLLADTPVLGEWLEIP